MPAFILRILATSSAAAMLFASQAGAAGLIDDNRAILRYSGEFSSALANAAPDDAYPRLHSRGFMGQLESTLKNRTDKPLTVKYPTPVSSNQLFTAAIVAPRGMEQADIPVCAEQNNRVLGLWNITAKGEVVAVTNWTGPVVPDTPDGMACKAFIVAARNEINAQYATMKPQQ